MLIVPPWKIHEHIPRMLGLRQLGREDFAVPADGSDDRVAGAACGAVLAGIGEGDHQEDREDRHDFLAVDLEESVHG